MTIEQEKILIEAQQYCDDEDKSTEFMLQYMADMAEVEYDAVVDWLMARAEKNGQLKQ